MNLTIDNLPKIKNTKIAKPADPIFSLPEKVLQFGTGVLLRGLPDYFIDKANRNGIFNGRIVVVKSTSGGEMEAFQEQNSLYTLCIRGIENGSQKEENIICSSISRVLSAQKQWKEIMAFAAAPSLKIVVSNTTEVGLQLIKESISENPPSSFPAKLLAVLYERYKAFEGSRDKGLVIIPTELISDNGKLLKSILNELAQHNQLPQGFINWLNDCNQFCSSLVDCIVPGKPEKELREEIEKSNGYTDQLLIMSEVYRLWAIEGNEEIRKHLSFAEISREVVITEDITKFKELKLRLLNGTHILSSGLAVLVGIQTVKNAMEDDLFSAFIKQTMMNEIAKAIPYTIPISETEDFGQKVLDRFSNPFIHHPWINITLNYSSKLAQRVVPVLVQYFELYKKTPNHIAAGFAGYIMFMKPIKKEGEKYYGEMNGNQYLINDENAAYFFSVWKTGERNQVVNTVLKNKKLWGMDLTELRGFEQSVAEKLETIIKSGARQLLKDISI